MFSSLLVAAVVSAPAAPVPKESLPNTTGPAPRVLAVKADGNGTVWITGQVYEKRKQTINMTVMENGKAVTKQQEREVMTSNYVRKTIGDFGGKFATADGKPLTTEEATRRVKGGAIVLISADGKPIDKSWLKAVADNTVVMLTEGLGSIYFQFGAAPMPMTPDPRMVMLCTNDEGIVRLPVNPNAAIGHGGQVAYDDLAGARVARAKLVVLNGGNVEIDGSVPAESQTTKPAASDGKKALEEIKFDAYDMSGKLIPRADALKRLKAGGLALVAGDNRFPDPEYLKAFRDDLIVIVSAELTFPQGTVNPFDTPGKPSAAPAKPGVRVAPAVQQLLPAAPLKQVIIKPAIIKQAVVPPPAP